ncbi:sulfurtransferase, partial [Paraglaciecola hydrolytica]
MKSNLLSVDSLKARLSDANLIVLFTSMADIATGQAEVLPPMLIPNSLFFDFENVFCDKSSGLPHTMPKQKDFQREARKLGINANSSLVVYDSKGLYSAARVWWMFKTMGHKDVVVLDGGLPAWLEAQYPVSDSLGMLGKSGDFTAQNIPGLMVDSTWVLNHLQQSSVIDARSSARFNGTAPEPRAGL